MDKPNSADEVDGHLVWPKLADWWLDEVVLDPAYDEEIKPLLMELLTPHPDFLYLDLGCGEGRLLHALIARGCRAVGCDITTDLLVIARDRGPVVKARLPDVGWARDGSFDSAFACLVLEHLPDEREFFRSLARIVRTGGTLVVIINHPIWTAPESSPIEDQGGETLWRPGRYFERGSSDEPAGRQTVRFYHRSLAELLNAASEAGWDLDRMEERGVSRAQMHRYPEYRGQEQIPRLMGARWIRR